MGTIIPNLGIIPRKTNENTMPIYEYHCTHCGENTEVLQKLSDAPEKTCPNCHKDNLVKQMSSPSFQLKGTGWYVTDFKNKKENKNKPAEAEKAKTEKLDTTKKTDTKTAEKTETTKTTETKNPEKSE